MSASQYHEDAKALSEKTKDVARVITSMIEEAEAISWYNQRIEASKDKEVKKILTHSMEEEMEHFAIELEWLTRKFPEWRKVLKAILFKNKDIVKNAEKYEDG